MTEQQYKIGDTVRITDRRCRFFDQAGMVKHIEGEDFPFGVEGLPDFNGIVWFRENELTHAAPEGDATPEAVDHPAHYGGDTTYEVFKVVEAWGLDKDAYLFNVIKYIARAGKKDTSKLLEDLKKGRAYLDRRIRRLEADQ